MSSIEWFDGGKADNTASKVKPDAAQKNPLVAEGVRSVAPLWDKTVAPDSRRRDNDDLESKRPTAPSAQYFASRHSQKKRHDSDADRACLTCQRTLDRKGGKMGVRIGVLKLPSMEKTMGYQWPLRCGLSSAVSRCSGATSIFDQGLGPRQGRAHNRCLLIRPRALSFGPRGRPVEMALQGEEGRRKEKEKRALQG